MCSFLGAGSGPAIIAVIGTLAGGGLGGWLTYWQQSRQRAHEDRVRFHELRIESYCAFDLVASNFIASAVVWEKEKPAGVSLDKYVLDNTEPYIAAFTRVRLIGTNAVAGIALKLHTVATSFLSTPAPIDVNAIAQEALRLQLEFVAAVRRELGTDS
jgi:hypothetical protein